VKTFDWKYRKILEERKKKMGTLKIFRNKLENERLNLIRKFGEDQTRGISKRE